jgi:hypothetical protein
MRPPARSGTRRPAGARAKRPIARPPGSYPDFDLAAGFRKARLGLETVARDLAELRRRAAERGPRPGS